MKILHPDHKIEKPLSQLTEYLNEGFYSIIAAKDKKRFAYFLQCFEAYRKENSEIIIKKSLYNNLPFSIQTPLWRTRQKDVHIIEKLIAGRNNLKILDIGCWNGWLCNYLSKKGHNLVGLGFFTDEYDGLKASKHYQTKYTSVQLQLDEIYRVKDTYDLIIFNRNWAYFKNSQQTFIDAKKMLSKDGVILFSGLTFHRNTLQIKNSIQRSDQAFRDRYNISLFLNAAKGYLDQKDCFFFKKNNIHLKPYSFINNVLKSTLTEKPLVKYGLYKKKGT